MDLIQPTSIDIRLATEHDSHLKWFDNTSLVALNTCPRWGLITYDQHRTLTGDNRSMALEAGDVCHQFFAAIRLYELLMDDRIDHSVREQLVNHHGIRIFKPDRYNYMLEGLNYKDDHRTNCLNFTLRALETSGYEDHVLDKRRTFSNIQEACIAYLDAYPLGEYPIWIRDIRNPTSDVGIENRFDVVITFNWTYQNYTMEEKSYRFVGRMDGIHHRRKNSNEICPHENKTGARIDEVWASSMEMSSQVTGYTIPASLLTNTECLRAVVIGLQIPLPKQYSLGVLRQSVDRSPHFKQDWLKWFLHTTQIWEQFKSDPVTAPGYTHSCSRYFRTCSLLPLCVQPEDERRQALEEMPIHVWNPLDE